MGGLLVYAVVRFRRRANDDGTEPAQIYGSGPVEAAWTIVPFLIVVVLALTHRAGHPRNSGRARTGLGAGRASHRASMVVGDSLSKTWHCHGQ